MLFLLSCLTLLGKQSVDGSSFKEEINHDVNSSKLPNVQFLPDKDTSEIQVGHFSELTLPFERIYHSSPASEVLALCHQAVRGVAIESIGMFPPYLHPWLSREICRGFISWYRTSVSFPLGKVSSNYLSHLPSELHHHTTA